MPWHSLPQDRSLRLTLIDLQPEITVVIGRMDGSNTESLMITEPHGGRFRISRIHGRCLSAVIVIFLSKNVYLVGMGVLQHYACAIQTQIYGAVNRGEPRRLSVAQTAAKHVVNLWNILHIADEHTMLLFMTGCSMFCIIVVNILKDRPQSMYIGCIVVSIMVLRLRKSA